MLSNWVGVLHRINANYREFWTALKKVLLGRCSSVGGRPPQVQAIFTKIKVARVGQPVIILIFPLLQDDPVAIYQRLGIHLAGLGAAQ